MSNIVIVGSGVVGTATGKGFASRSHQVQFVDIDADTISALRAEGYDATDKITLSDEPAFIFLTLPTPNEGRRWDLSALRSGVRSVGEALSRSDGYHTVVTRSTVPPRTTEQIVQPLLEQTSGLRAGDGFAVASNPEFLRAKCAYEDFIFPWTTVIGARSQRTVERLGNLLRPFGGELISFSDPAVPELIKCSHNLFNAAKISFWNEIWQVAQHLGLDADRVSSVVARSAEASFNPSYGIRGGSPYGGACLPKDTKGFLGFARELGVDMPVLEAVDRVNEHMVAMQSSRTIDVRDTASAIAPSAA